MAFNVAKIASARASLTISLTKSLRVAGPLIVSTVGTRQRGQCRTAQSPFHTSDADETSAGTHFQADEPPDRFIFRSLTPTISR